MNDTIEAFNDIRKKKLQNVIESRIYFISYFTYFESRDAKRGTRLWNKSEKSSFCNNIDFKEYLKEWRFKEIEIVIPSIMKNDEAKVYNDWWQFSKQIELFNKVQKEKLKQLCIHVLDKST